MGDILEKLSYLDSNVCIENSEILFLKEKRREWILEDRHSVLYSPSFGSCQRGWLISFKLRCKYVIREQDEVSRDTLMLMHLILTPYNLTLCIFISLPSSIVD